jgi:hypothetical protein
MSVENVGDGKKHYHAVFPAGKDNAAPVRMEARVPIRTYKIVLRISDMKRLPYGLFPVSN